MKEEHRSYRRNFCSCEKEALKNSGLYGIQTLVVTVVFNLVSSDFPLEMGKGKNPRGRGCLDFKRQRFSH